MPYLFDSNYQFKDSQYQIEAKEILDRFPFLNEKIIHGEILAAFIDGKVVRYKLPFMCKTIQSYSGSLIAEISGPNPLKEKGIPPCSLLLVILKYEEKTDDKETRELPISEGLLLRKSYFPSHFEDIVKRIFREEEIRLILESTIFHRDLKNQAELLRKAYLSFEEEMYPDVKTSCRKILESLRNKAIDWEKIDDSKNLYEKFKRTLNSIYSFASIGGPHEGITTKEETEFIMKIVAPLLFYVNALLKNNRIAFKENKIKNTTLE